MSSTATVDPPIGAKVRHDKFGAGEVMDVGGGQATVMFGDETARVHVDRLEWEGKLAPSVDDEPEAVIGSLIQQVDGRYVVATKDGTRHLTDFAFTVDARVYVGGDESDLIFSVSVNGKRLDDLPASMFSQPAKFQAYLNRQGLSWDGTPRDLRGLFYFLNLIDAPVKTGVTSTGLHGGTWVLPDETFGPDAGKYAFVPSVFNVRPRYRLERDEIGFETFEAFEQIAQLHRPDVITPILGWMAAAPLRSLCKTFPVLAVTGGSGWGKTTLIGTVLESFGFTADSKCHLQLKGSTPLAVSAWGAVSNAFPVWFDEYRADVSRAETKERFWQLLRDAWDGSSHARGGMSSDNLTRVSNVPACAPLIVTGEDAFTETSHLERMIVVNMPKDGRNVAALSALDSDDYGRPLRSYLDGFGRAYLEWLSEYEFIEPPVTYVRQDQGRAICRWGYDMLATFCIENGADILSPYEEGRVKSHADEAAQTSPILDAIDEACGINDRDLRPIVWDADGFRHVRSGALCKWIRDNRSDQLPGGAQAVTSFLRETFKAAEYNHPNYRRCYRWAVEM